MGWLANEKKLGKDHSPHTRGTLALGLLKPPACDGQSISHAQRQFHAAEKYSTGGHIRAFGQISA